MFCVFTEVMAQDDKLLLNKTRLIFSFYLCLRLTSPNYAFMRCRLYNNQCMDDLAENFVTEIAQTFQSLT